MEKKRILTIASFFIVVISSFVLVSVFKEQYDCESTLNVLMLHMVVDEMPEDKSLSGLYITQDMLRRYVEYFSEKYTVVSLDEAYDIIKNNKDVENPNLIAFTFDDGYENNYTLAFPVFKEFNVPANINIIAKYTDEEYEGYLTWEQVKEMSDSGLITIGSHTYNSHYYTADVNGEDKPVLAAFLLEESDSERKERIYSDLALANDMISNVTEKRVNVMVYPYGVPPFDLVDEIESKFGYDMQILVRPGVNRGLKSFSAVKRFTVDGNKTPEELERTMKNYYGLSFLGGKK